ncbi:MAG: high frequency lysogenization protein HflD [Cellvibrionales bacterium]|nr:high frequency lysogenization protein HflD [Cellvibrionales bacterium]
MSASSVANRTIALSGMYQAAQCVIDLATTGDCDPFYYAQSINSLFVFDPNTTLDVFGGELKNIEGGIKGVRHFYEHKNSPNHQQMIKTLLSLIALHKQATKEPELLKVIHSRLTHIEYKQAHFSDDDSAIATSLSGLYQDTLSQLKFRIIVQGNIQHLNNRVISDKIRALLLAGFRATLLWRQVGGKRWQLVFKRGEMEKSAQFLLSQLQQQPIDK